MDASGRLPAPGLPGRVHRGRPRAPLLLVLLSVGVAVVGLLMVVMRALLRQATTLRADMEAVI